MPTSQDNAIQLAKVEERLSNLGGEIREDIRELKEGQEEQWRQFRKHQEKATDNEKLILRTLDEVKGLVIINKQHCDNRFKDIENDKRRTDLRYKVRIGALVTVITTSATVLTNLAVTAIKIHWSIA